MLIVGLENGQSHASYTIGKNDGEEASTRALLLDYLADTDRAGDAALNASACTFILCQALSDQIASLQKESALLEDQLTVLTNFREQAMLLERGGKGAIEPGDGSASLARYTFN